MSRSVLSSSRLPAVAHAFRRAALPFVLGVGMTLTGSAVALAGGDVEAGHEASKTCVACHGADAKGNPMLGAPDLTNNVWLYGSSEATIIETITHGRNNKMPAFGEFLGEDKVHILSAYVLSLSKK